MKSLLLIAVLCISAFAQIPQRTFSQTLTATGPTSSINTFGGYTGYEPASMHTIAAIVTGSPTGCTLRLEGSADGTNWFDLSGSQSCTSSVMFHVDGKAAAYVRANLLTLSGGTSPTVAITYRGTN